MNHIARLTEERERLRALVRETRDKLTDLERYLASDKFHGPGNDYVHVRTDIGPKITALRIALCGE